MQMMLAIPEGEMDVTQRRSDSRHVTPLTEFSMPVSCVEVLWNLFGLSSIAKL